MATNKLLPFANGDEVNVLDFSQWETLPARKTGFQSGIAKSAEFNYILAQGGTAGYIWGQFAVDYAGVDATLKAPELYASVKTAIAAFVPRAVADNAINGSKLTDGTVTGAKLEANGVTFDKMNTSAIATDEEAKAGTATKKLMTPKGVAAAIAQQLATAFPTGMIAFFALKNIPDGWLLCNGANVSRTTYANLFAAIGTNFGSGDGSTTFTLPNMGGRFIEGATSVVDVGKTYESGLPNIEGSFKILYADYHNNKGLISDCVGFIYEHPSDSSVGKYIGTGNDVGIISQYKMSASRSSPAFGSSSGVQPPSVALLPCIKS